MVLVYHSEPLRLNYKHNNSLFDTLLLLLEILLYWFLHDVVNIINLLVQTKYSNFTDQIVRLSATTIAVLSKNYMHKKSGF